MDIKERCDRRERDDAFVVDGRYLQAQANEAISTFLAPLKGIYRAAVGKPSTIKFRTKNRTSL